MQTYLRDLHRIRHGAKYSLWGLLEQAKFEEEQLRTKHAEVFAVHRAVSQLLGRPSPPLLTMSTALVVTAGSTWAAARFMQRFPVLPQRALSYAPYVTTGGLAVKAVYCRDFNAISHYQATQHAASEWQRIFERGNVLRYKLLREYRATLAAHERGDEAAVEVSFGLRAELTQWMSDYSVAYNLVRIPQEYYNIGREDLNKTFEMQDINQDREDFQIDPK